MVDSELKANVRSFKARYGASYAYIARRSGVSREHISRWVNSDSYLISDELKAKIKSIIKGEM